jgi:hypothetical protein
MKTQPLSNFIKEVKLHENQHTMPYTNGKNGIVGKSLVGYHYTSLGNKENEHMA